MNNVNEYISTIKDRWFIYEPALFLVLCTFPVEYSTKTDNIMTGSRNIKVNADFFSDKTYEVFEEFLKAECIRILLEHPFRRSLPIPQLAYVASNILIGTHFNFNHIKYPSESKFKGFAYEDIYKEMYKELPSRSKQNGGGNSNNGGSAVDGGSCSGDSQNSNNESQTSNIENSIPDGYKEPFGDGDTEKNTSEWGYDELSRALVGKIKAKAASSNSWGSIPMDLVSIIQADDTPEYNYKTAIRRFRKNVISSDVDLTRMKPNRRWGYEQMGKRRTYKSNLLLVCDTSGSMSDAVIGKFCGFVNGFFSYGMADIDTITFDVRTMDNTLRSIKQKMTFIKTESRGGTDISDILDYVNERSKKKYSGVIVFTDGWFSYDKEKWESEMSDVKYLFCITDENGFERFNKEKDKRIESSYIQL
jgi:hypothetical protein